MAVSRVMRHMGAYRNAVRISTDKRILVEGRDDRTVFDRLFRAMREAGRVHERVIIDTAEDIESPDGVVLGNREKVEAICTYLSTSDVGGRFAGFVDRELRGFRLDDAPGDSVRKVLYFPRWQTAG